MKISVAQMHRVLSELAALRTQLGVLVDAVTQIKFDLDKIGTAFEAFVDQVGKDLTAISAKIAALQAAATDPAQAAALAEVVTAADALAERVTTEAESLGKAMDAAAG